MDIQKHKDSELSVPVKSAEEILEALFKANPIWNCKKDVLLAMETYASQFKQPATNEAVNKGVKYRVGRKLGQVILTVNGETEIGRIYDNHLALRVCDFLNKDNEAAPITNPIEVIKKRVVSDTELFEVLQECAKQLERFLPTTTFTLRKLESILKLIQ